MDYQTLLGLITTPYLPTLGPVHPDCIGTPLLEDIESVRGSHQPLPYDKDIRWSAVKQEVLIGWYASDGCAYALTKKGQNNHAYLYGTATRQLLNELRAKAARIVHFTPGLGGAQLTIFVQEFASSHQHEADPHIRPLSALNDAQRASIAKLYAEPANAGFKVIDTSDALEPFLMYVVGDEVLGGIGPFTVLPDKNGTPMLLPHYFGVHSDHRKQGIGTTLWRAHAAFAAQLGVQYMLFQSEPHNAAFYAGLGMRPLGDLWVVSSESAGA